MNNFNLPHIPNRGEKPRQNGLTMMMDKGLSLRETEDFIASSGHLTDIVKFGFGTSFVTNDFQEKINLYKANNIKPYLGGTLFEAFIARNMFDDYRKLIDQYGLELMEVSDGSIVIPHDEKCEYISTLKQHGTVMSEVGSKEAGIVLTPETWIEMI